MCGLAGLVHFADPAQVERGLLTRMRDRMTHRGPDGAGLWVSDDGRVGLAHRRLAILDLSDAAAQPMTNEDGSCVVVFNGEIYNHADLRADLERAGHRFRTDHSDTEVIVHAYEEWGRSCVHRFRGMFAFALWDTRTRTVWLVRDRIGIKPLYYTVRDGRLAFASEIKALLEDPRIPRRIDEEALYHYLTFLTTPAPSTLFAGIRKLAGGTWAVLDLDEGALRVERYWDVFDDVRALDGADESEIAERLLSELRTAVQLRKVSDVPVGVFLSGGIDSSTNAALFAEGGDAVHTFSIGYERDYPSYRNEFDFARMVADRIGAVHHERRLTQHDVLEIMPFLVHHQDEPIADPVCVPVYYVARLAREAGVIVCQVGEGSDELFLGYPDWLSKLRLQRLADAPVPAILKRAGLAALGAAGQGGGRPYELLRRDVAGQPVFWGGAEAFSERAKRMLLAPRLRREFAGFSSYEAVRPIRERFLERAPEGAGHAEWASYLDLNLRLPELLLMRVDKMSMATSVECRVPFLDHVFVALAMSIPSALKLGGGEPKHILKRAVRGVIPDAVIDRPKQGFGVPVADWLFDELGQRIRAEVREFAGETDVLDPCALDRFFERGAAPGVWTLYNLAAWWRGHQGSAACP